MSVKSLIDAAVADLEAARAVDRVACLAHREALHVQAKRTQELVGSMVMPVVVRALEGNEGVRQAQLIELVVDELGLTGDSAAYVRRNLRAHLAWSRCLARSVEKRPNRAGKLQPQVVWYLAQAIEEAS